MRDEHDKSERQWPVILSLVERFLIAGAILCVGWDVTHAEGAGAGRAVEEEAGRARVETAARTYQRLVSFEASCVGERSAAKGAPVHGSGRGASGFEAIAVEVEAARPWVPAPLMDAFHAYRTQIERCIQHEDAAADAELREAARSRVTSEIASMLRATPRGSGASESRIRVE